MSKRKMGASGKAADPSSTASAKGTDILSFTLTGSSNYCRGEEYCTITGRNRRGNILRFEARMTILPDGLSDLPDPDLECWVGEREPFVGIWTGGIPAKPCDNCGWSDDHGTREMGFDLIVGEEEKTTVPVATVRIENQSKTLTIREEDPAHRERFLEIFGDFLLS